MKKKEILGKRFDTVRKKTITEEKVLPQKELYVEAGLFQFMKTHC